MNNAAYYRYRESYHHNYWYKESTYDFYRARSHRHHHGVNPLLLSLVLSGQVASVPLALALAVTL